MKSLQVGVPSKERQKLKRRNLKGLVVLETSFPAEPASQVRKATEAAGDRQIQEGKEAPLPALENWDDVEILHAVLTEEFMMAVHARKRQARL
ncbi:hypothetical protein HPP92_027481 [Vanilla planifolia]|uniref:Uncharacterized protein n=1 Tax=Vanilla planifolia TaxID=51239 RepID=A0A835V1Z6_VANPL|nr:hypothetical protein HPP92_027481 [Vanilla planifolia]KAG0484374.1 hypothetical protein HPP92_008453 [Vanilla planifolia]